MNRFAVTLLASSFLLGLATVAGTPARAQEATLKLHHFVPPGAPPHARFLKPWADKVMADSKGRIKVEIYPAMGLGGKPPELVNQVRDGIVDVIWTVHGFTPGRFPITEVFELPFVNADPLTMAKAIMEFYPQHLRDEYKDYHVLGMWSHAGQLFHSNKAVRKVEDLKGLTVRTSGQAGTLFLESVGATPIQAPITEAASLLSKGVVDAVLLPYEIVPSYKLHELTKFHITLAGGKRFQVQTFLFAMNRARYDRLPADLKAVIDANSGARIAETVGRIWTEIEGPGERMARDRGNEVIALSKSDSERIEQLSRVAVERWIGGVKAKGIDGQKMVEAAKAAIAKHQGR
jgi:TRAP-type C4-dicarboxylate transport system substrate-binding protein